MYDPATSLLSIPAVKVGASTFLDVTLLNLGNYTFALQAATELPAAILNAANALLASVDTLWATQVPRTGESRMSLNDGCYRDDGKTRAFLVSETDADPNSTYQRDAYRLGSTRSNLQVLALRNRVNADGSARQEIDVQYDVAHKDGSSEFGEQWTLVSGSTSGTPGCSTPQNSAALRYLGNQRLVSVAMRARNGRDERRSVSSGAGPAAAVGNTVVPFSLKFIAPRLLRSAPELQGKTGNFLNWLDGDSWRYCRVAGKATPLASTADCVGQGASSSEMGITTSTPNAAADQSFAAQGWVAGAVYRFDVYTDDGWKTVNGHAGKTPLATYFSTLDVLPYSFVEMAGSGAGDKFAR